MALNFAASTSFPAPSLRAPVFVFPKHKATFNKPICSDKHHTPCRAAQSGGVTEDPDLTGSSARTQLDLLEQLTSTSSSGGADWT
ncbi:myosin-G heavy chain-like protein isoform X2 [Tasmannia lanceolata]|uniref:myosin-G heavy chain-like protein isoform X2 n=1 Tax=Tasmannia lanceolata TaxID=3420 RepID=UPI004063B746